MTLHASLRTVPFLLICPLIAALSGCPGSGVPDASDAPQDVAQPDAASDTSADAQPDEGSDAGWPACTVPAIRIGGTAATDAIAMAPARCGQTAHTWINDPTLGTIDARGATQDYGASALRLLAQGANVMLPVTLQHDVHLEQLSYVTQDRGHLVSATTLVMWPDHLTHAGSFDVIMVLHGTSGFMDGCAPSNDSGTRLLAAAFASAGYVVVAPDYIGLRGFGGPSGIPHPYLVGQATAIASLDAVRAALRHVASLHGPACATARVAVVGGSQGGHAALWVDRLAPYYAPELELAGVVATVPPADLTAEGNRALTAVVPATANMVAFFGTAPAWYGLAGRLGELFVSPFETQVPAALAASCDPRSMIAFTTLDQMFQPAVLSAATSAAGIGPLAPWGCVLTENSLTTTSIPRIAPTRAGYGILYALGEADQLVNTPIERTSFQTLCTQGMPMQFLECAGASHTQTTGWALPEVFDFMRARLAGTPMDAADTCVLHDPVRCRATP